MVDPEVVDVFSLMIVMSEKLLGNGHRLTVYEGDMF
jgi:hypothetical protein